MLLNNSAPGPNLYGYVLNDPINLVDPRGLDVIVNDMVDPLIVSGNPGSGHGVGNQVYGVVPPSAVGGGQYNGIPSFPNLDDAKRYRDYMQKRRQSSCPVRPDPSQAINDVDWYYPPGGPPQQIHGDDVAPETAIGPDGIARDRVLRSLLNYVLRPFE